MIGSNLNDGLKYAGHYIAHPSRYSKKKKYFFVGKLFFSHKKGSFSNFTRRLPQLLFNKAPEDVTPRDTQLAELIKKYGTTKQLLRNYFLSFLKELRPWRLLVQPPPQHAGRRADAQRHALSRKSNENIKFGFF